MPPEPGPPRSAFPELVALAVAWRPGWTEPAVAGVRSFVAPQVMYNLTIADTHTDLLTPTLAILRQLGKPFVVENVPGAKRYMHPTLLLHGGMFGLGVHRPRYFESSELIFACKARQTSRPVGVYGDHPQNHYSTRQNGDMKGKRSEFRRARTIDEARELMGMPWAKIGRASCRERV